MSGRAAQLTATKGPFLPLLVKELNSGLVSSVPFTIYYLFFALVLIPAGNLAARGRIKEIMALGFIAEVAGCIIVAVSNSIPLLTVGRAISGLGQGCFLIGFYLRKLHYPDAGHGRGRPGGRSDYGACIVAGGH